MPHGRGNFPTAEINFRARLSADFTRAYAGIKAPSSPFCQPLSYPSPRVTPPFICEGGEGNTSRRVFREIPDTSCTNFQPISSCNAERAKNSDDGKILFIALSAVNPFCWSAISALLEYFAGSRVKPRDVTLQKSEAYEKNATSFVYHGNYYYYSFLSLSLFLRKVFQIIVLYISR